MSEHIQLICDYYYYYYYTIFSDQATLLKIFFSYNNDYGA
jgi:hypothetical protein